MDPRHGRRRRYAYWHGDEQSLVGLPAHYPSRRAMGSVGYGIDKPADVLLGGAGRAADGEGNRVALASDLYNRGEYLANNPDWHAADSQWKAAHIRDMLARNGISPKTLVEVGCGAGGIVAELARTLPVEQAVGYDISGDAARLWPAAPPPNVHYRRADFTAGSDTYDLLLLVDVFEHVDDYIGFLRGLRGRARWFVFHIPLDLSVLGLLRKRHMRGRAEVGHLHYFTRESALATLETAGYAVRDWTYTALAIEAGVEQRTWRTRLANLPRRLVAAFDTATAATLLGGYSVLALAEAAHLDEGYGVGE